VHVDGLHQRQVVDGADGRDRQLSRPARGGGRWVAVAPERLDHWLREFGTRHGVPVVTADSHQVVLAAPDGAVAECEVPFGPLIVDAGDELGGLVAHAGADRTVGVLLVRLGGFAAGVFDGPRLLDSKVGSRPVHGRAAAGGWSQKRFARRREGQAHIAVEAAVETALRILVPVAATLDAVVLGGDRRALDAVLADARLAGLRALVSGRVLDVADPNRRVLESAYGLFRAVAIRIVDAPPVDGTIAH
jgi:hypothetical protein